MPPGFRGLGGVTLAGLRRLRSTVGGEIAARLLRVRTLGRVTVAGLLIVSCTAAPAPGSATARPPSSANGSPARAAASEAAASPSAGRAAASAVPPAASAGSGAASAVPAAGSAGSGAASGGPASANATPAAASGGPASANAAPAAVSGVAASGPAGAASTPPSASLAPTRSAVARASVSAVAAPEIEAIFARLPKPSNAAFESLVSREHAELDSQAEVPSASIIKLPIMIATLRQIGAGKLSASTPLTVQRDQVVGGSGVLQGQVGRTLTTTELLETTLSYSDNTGGNMLTDAIGGLAVVNATMAELGFEHTHMRRRLMDTQAQQRGLENTVSAADVVNMLKQIWSGDLLSKADSAEMLRILRLRGKITDPSLDFVGRHLTPRPTIAHLNGTLAAVRNDAAIIELSKSPFIVVMLLHDQHNEPAAEEAIARSTAAIVDLVQ